MGAVKNITHNSFPEQGTLLGCLVKVGFHYDTDHTINGKIVRDDAEEPGRLIIALENGTYVLATECQYSFRVCQSYTYHMDPGHGWLQVPERDIIELGLTDLISSCSYRGGAYNNLIFLEEDCDMPLFLEAWKRLAGGEPETHGENHADDCFIRDLQPYVPYVHV